MSESPTLLRYAWNKAWNTKQILLILGSSGGLYAILSFPNDFFGVSNLKSAGLSAIFLLSFFLLRFLWILVAQANKVKLSGDSAKVIPGDTVIELNNAYALVNRYREESGLQDTQFDDIMENFCEALKNIYDRITNANCSVSIKLPVESSQVDGKTIMESCYRDYKHLKKRHNPKYLNTVHSIMKNTCYTVTLSKLQSGKEKRHYLNNDIPKAGEDYVNTTIDSKGKLPYKSELVHPIARYYLQNDKNYTCQGYICVDSDKADVFESTYCTAIIEGVSDGLYDIISERNDSMVNK